uniref:Putative ribonuclease H-like domain-containing protein n=1 Tax=Tanacetum cinerariifolium TaxID=118510 RepID=A0A699GY52_TANCI|nr:putative ribonuclease H-like domain-containing protein [Tanacetum cinerariifolium]
MTILPLEVIKNGNKVLKRTVGTVEQIYEPTSAEEKLDRKNEMKTRGTLLMELPNKDQLKFHSYQDAKFIMEAIEKRYGGNRESKKKTHALIWRNKADIETISLDDFYNNLKIYEPKLIGSSSTSQNPQNMAFISSNSTNSTSSTNEADNTAYGVSITHTQGNIVNSTSIDNLSDVVICAFFASQPNSPRLAREDLEQIDLDDLEEMDLHLEMAMLTIRARRFIKRTGRNLDINCQKIGFDSYQAEEEHPTNYALMALTSSGSSSSSDSEVDSYSRTEERLAHYKKNEIIFKEKINILNLEVKLRDNALVENTKNAEKEIDELKLTLEKFQNSSKSLNNLLEYQVSDKVKTGLGYKAASPAVESFVNSSEMLENQENVKSRSDKGYHVVPPPYTGSYIPPKPDLMFIDEQVKSDSVDVVSNVASSDVKTVESKHEPISNAYKRGHSQLIRPYNKYSAYKKMIFYKMVNNAKVKETTARERAVGNPQQKKYKEKGVIDIDCSRHITGNKCYLSDSEDYDGGLFPLEMVKAEFLGKMLISWQCKKQIVVTNSTTEDYEEYVAAANCCGQVLWIQNQMLFYGFNFLNIKIYVDNENRMEKAATTASNLEAEQDIGNINRTQSIATLNETLPQGTGSGSGPRASNGYTKVDILLFPTMLVQGLQGEGSTVLFESYQTPSGDLTISQPRHSSPSRVPTSPYNSPLPGGHTPGSDEGSLTLNELTVLCTILSNKVESLETELKLTKQTYGAAFTKLIKKLGVLSAAKILADATRVHTYNRRRAVSTGRDGVSTASRIISTAKEIVSIVGVSMPISTAESEPKQTTTKLRERQERAGYEVAIRLQEHLDEEENQRIARIQDFVPMEKEGNKEVSKLTGAGGSKRDAEEELDQGSSKKQKTDEASGSV